MANNEQTTVLNIEVNYANGIKAIAQYKTQIDALKKAEKEYKKQLDEGKITQQEYNEAIAKSKMEITELKEKSQLMEKQLKNQVKIQKEQEGSLKQLRAELSNLTAAYDAMSQAERDGAKGTALKKKINDVTDALKEVEEGTQRYYRNVGNYEERDPAE